MPISRPHLFVNTGMIGFGSSTLTSQIVSLLASNPKIVLVVDFPLASAEEKLEDIFLLVCKNFPRDPVFTPEQLEELFKGFSAKSFPLHKEDLSGISLVQNHPNFRTVRIRGPT
jgi:hypothetical protein